MNTGDLSDVYRSYIGCLNRQDWPALGQFVGDEARYVWSVIDKPAIEAQL